jgi:hypothetical protein
MIMDNMFRVKKTSINAGNIYCNTMIKRDLVLHKIEVIIRSILY